MLCGFSVQNFKNFSASVSVHLPQKAVLIGACGSGKTNLGQALFKIREHYDKPEFSLRREDICEMCEASPVKLEYNFLLEGHALLYRLIWMAGNGRPQQCVEVDGQRVFSGAGNSICEIAQVLKADYNGVTGRWKEFVRGMQYAADGTAAKSCTFLMIDDFAAHMTEQMLEESVQELYEGNTQVLLLTSKLAVLDLKSLPVEGYLVLQDNRVKPMTELTDKRIERCHNLRKWFKACGFTQKP